MDDLTGKVAFVTGAGQGIGRALCRGFAGEGIVVIAGDSDMEGAQQTVEEIVSTGGRAFATQVDVSEAHQVDAAMGAVSERAGGIDILVNNAGIFPRSPLLDMEESEWDRVLAVNLKGTFLCSRAAARLMVAQGRGGRIVNVTSGSAWRPSKNGSHYVASKGGIAAFTRALATELAPHQITVNALVPGLVDTAQPRIVYSDEDLGEIAKTIPLGRIAQPEDMVGPVRFLCSSDASYITGQMLHVNGGLIMA